MEDFMKKPLDEFMKQSLENSEAIPAEIPKDFFQTSSYKIF